MVDFSLGQLLATPAALAALQRAQRAPAEYLARHAIGDWGEVDGEDKRRNDLAVQDGSRLLSVYEVDPGVKIWVITEAANDHGHREATTILLPEEY